MLSTLPNGELKGELLRVYVLGLFDSEETASLLDSVLHLRGWPREINAFRPTNQTSASSLSLQIWQRRKSVHQIVKSIQIYRAQSDTLKKKFLIGNDTSKYQTEEGSN